MNADLLDKYNVPVPRYTSYPPANYFNEAFTAHDYREAIEKSNTSSPSHISFYLHMPFCKRLCHYCGCNAYPISKKDKMEQYISALHKEIDMVVKLLDKKRNIAQIHYGGGTPTAIPVHHLKELNEHLLSAFSHIENPEIAIECHPGYVDGEYWEGLIDAGFNRFSLGIQDFNEKVLKTVNRKPSLLPTSEIFNILRKSNAKINMDFIYGLPFQTPESFTETISEAISFAPDRLVTFSYAHVPWVNKHQMILERAGLPASDVKNKMYEYATDLLKSDGYKAIGLDHFVKEEDELYTALQDGRLHRNFQGYCTRRTTGQVYAFGVTGISQLCNAYSQNSKDITEYINAISNGDFPIIKGYSLNEEEQITREVIEALMCNYSLKWETMANSLNKPIHDIQCAIGYNEEKLREFEKDGIIQFDDKEIRMTHEGRLFVRNVAASMDKLMVNSQKTFSKPV
jgi:oxygen-independent coproporphyrinogen III oxidase